MLALMEYHHQLMEYLHQLEAHLQSQQKEHQIALSLILASLMKHFVLANFLLLDLLAHQF